VLVSGDTSTAAITITGTNASEQILINWLPGSINQIQIFALAGTTLSLDGSSSYTGTGASVTQVGSFITITPVPGTVNLTINMGGGDDSVSMYHTVLFTPIQIGTLSVDLGAGNDIFQLQGQGIVNTRIGTLVFDAGAGNDRVVFDATQVGDNSGVCRLGDGDDTIFRKGSGTSMFTVSAPWRLDLGRGNDTAQFLDTKFGHILRGPVAGGGLEVRGGAGNDTVVFGGSGTLLGDANLELGYNLVCNRLVIDLGIGSDRLIVPSPSNGGHTNLFYARRSDGLNARIIMGPTQGDGHDLIRWGSGGGAGKSVAFGVFDGVPADVDIWMGSGNDRIYIRQAIFNLLIVLMQDGDDRVLNHWGSDGVTVNTSGSKLHGGAHVQGDTLVAGFTPPSNLSVSAFHP
jgi:hypothetical protein